MTLIGRDDVVACTERLAVSQAGVEVRHLPDLLSTDPALAEIASADSLLQMVVSEIAAVTRAATPQVAVDDIDPRGGPRLTNTDHPVYAGAPNGGVVSLSPLTAPNVECTPRLPSG